MSAAREIIAKLIAAGLDAVDAAALMARAAMEMSVGGPSKAALRTRKWREGRASQNVTGDGSVTPEPSVTERHQTSQSVTGDNAPLSSFLTSDENKHSEKKEKREANRGCRLPANWDPPVADLEAATALIGMQRADDELAKFRDHWKAQPGSKGVKTDWPATWRNWYRRAHEYGGNRNGNGTRAFAGAGQQSGSAAIIAGTAAAVERRARERGAGGPRRDAPGGGGPAGGDEPEFFGSRDH